MVEMLDVVTVNRPGEVARKDVYMNGKQSQAAPLQGPGSSDRRPTPAGPAAIVARPASCARCRCAGQS
jgi:hypothetical protein